METIRNYNLIRPKENILVGVSGGPDSMVLLYLLMELKDDLDFNILVAHVNHGVRGKEARRDQEFVKEQAKKLGLPYFSKKVDMIAYAKAKGISEEEAGRKLRYGFFREVLANQGGGKIAVAHNKNDQAETLLMRIFRGTGIDGLKGMDFKTRDIIRPLLNIERIEIESYMKENKIETVLDRTNLEPIYTRNRIRLELIPYIEKHFNPNLVDSLWRLSQTSQSDSRFLDQYSREKLNQILKSQDKDCIILNADLFRQEDKSIQQRIIRLIISDLLNSLQGITENHISMVMNLFNTGETGKEVHLPNDLIARTSYKKLIFSRNKAVKNINFLYNIKLGVNEFPKIGYRFDIEVLPVEKLGTIKRDKTVGLFDYDKIQGNLYLRNRKVGDRFVPFGMRGSKKIKDYFIDEKIPRQLREKIPLIVDNKNILWVVGYRTSNLYKITKDTKKILKIQFMRHRIEEDKNGKGH